MCSGTEAEAKYGCGEDNQKTVHQFLCRIRTGGGNRQAQ